MFDKKKNMIRIFIYENVMLYPPTLNLIECLLNNDYKVHLVAEGVKNLPTIIAEDKRFSYTEIKAVKNSNIFLRLKKRGIKTKVAHKTPTIILKAVRTQRDASPSRTSECLRT